ncbi:MAG: hypothetical protein Hens3KO_13200 [Henriciella sp.]
MVIGFGKRIPAHPRNFLRGGFKRGSDDTPIIKLGQVPRNPADIIPSITTLFQELV